MIRTCEEVAEMEAPRQKRKARESEISMTTTTSSVQFKTRCLVARSSGCDNESQVAKESSNLADPEINVDEYMATSGAGQYVDSRNRVVEARESGELESSAVLPRDSSYNSQRGSTAADKEKMPTQTEVDEFFAAAQINLHKQFTDKYNFDMVKDEPLDGRYEWVPVELLNP